MPSDTQGILGDSFPPRRPFLHLALMVPMADNANQEVGEQLLSDTLGKFGRTYLDGTEKRYVGEA